MIRFVFTVALLSEGRSINAGQRIKKVSAEMGAEHAEGKLSFSLEIQPSVSDFNPLVDYFFVFRRVA
jgi:hypothetical protein